MTVYRKCRLPVEAGVDVVVSVVTATGLGAALSPRVALSVGHAVVHTERCNNHNSADVHTQRCNNHNSADVHTQRCNNHNSADVHTQRCNNHNSADVHTQRCNSNNSATPLYYLSTPSVQSISEDNLLPNDKDISRVRLGIQ